MNRVEACRPDIENRNAGDSRGQCPCGWATAWKTYAAVLENVGRHHKQTTWRRAKGTSVMRRREPGRSGYWVAVCASCHAIEKDLFATGATSWAQQHKCRDNTETERGGTNEK